MKIIKKIGFNLFLLISLLYLFIVISPQIFKNFYPFGIKTAVVLTGSMEPTLKINDFVVVKYPNEIKVNDIISYKQDNLNQEVMHRVVKITDDIVITKGDANNTEDQPILRDQITGVYIGKIKYLGNFVSFVSKPIVFSFLVTLLSVLIVSTKRRNNKHKFNNEKHKTKYKFGKHSYN